MSKFSKVAFEQVVKAMPKWYQEIIEIDQSLLTDGQLDQVLDAEFMIMSVMQQPQTKLRGVSDNSGNVKAVASISIDPDAVYIEYLVTTPKSLNLLGYTERVIGAARALVITLVQESLSLGLGGKIRATSLEGAIKFYEDLGFVGKGRIVLSTLAAQNLLNEYGEIVQ
jgi:hypothetical protein